MKVMSFIWRTSRPLSLAAFALSVLGGCASAGIIWLIQLALKRDVSLIGPVGLGFVLLSTLICLSRIASEVLLVHLSHQGMLRLVMGISENMLACPLRHLEQIGKHRLTAALTDDVSVITVGLISVPASMLDGTIVVVSLIYLGYLSLAAVAAVLILAIAGIALLRISFVRAECYLAAAREDRDGLFDGFRSLVGGVKELKLNSRKRAEFLYKSVHQRAMSFRRNNLIASAIYVTTGSGGLLLFYLLLGITLFVLPSLLGVTRGALTGYIVILLFIMMPIDSLINLIPNIERGSFALLQLEKLGIELTDKCGITVADVSLPPVAAWGSLQLRGVRHSYDGRGDVSGFHTGPIDLQIIPGEVTFLMGGNGSGKTTLAKILAGLYTPDTGEIRVAGKRVTENTRDQYRDQFTAIFGDFHLFKTLLGIDPVRVDQQGKMYLKMLRLDQQVSIKDHALSSLDLSQGQRKRLALLTALLEDRPIYLFDEWAADQDAFFRSFFYEELIVQLKRQGKTVIVITHDEHSVHIADHVIRLDAGRIIYDGPPDAVSIQPVIRGSLADPQAPLVNE